jgi:hypothetical protein
LIIIILLLIVILPITMLKLLGMRAEKLVAFEISGLTRDQIIDIGTKARRCAGFAAGPRSSRSTTRPAASPGTRNAMAGT